MGRRADLEAGGGRFDSRRAKVTFFEHVGMVFSSIFTHVWTGLGALFGRVWGTFGEGLGHFLGGFGILFGTLCGRVSKYFPYIYMGSAAWAEPLNKQQSYEF